MPKEIKSLDIGTMYLISSSRGKNGSVDFKKLRHAFLKIQIESSMLSFLREEGMHYAEIDRDLFVLGESAFNTAYTIGKNICRPMQNGVLNPQEEKAEIVLRLLVEALIGKASEKESVCYYSIPAEPFDSEHRVLYHSEIIREILDDLGYQSQPVNEGLAVVFSSLAEKNFTGIGISCGCGLLNVCVSHQAQVVESFSSNRAGDWIDENASKVMGIKASKVTTVKEKGINLEAPRNKIEKAVAIYYRDLIRHLIECLKVKCENNEKMSVFTKPIDIVLAGGTSLPDGFISLFKGELEKVRMPFNVNDVTLAQDPLYSIAQGCLIGAMSSG